jgi:hypothetical protein
VLGGKVKYEPLAVCDTDAPDWMFALLTCALLFIAIHRESVRLLWIVPILEYYGSFILGGALIISVVDEVRSGGMDLVKSPIEIEPSAMNETSMQKELESRGSEKSGGLHLMGCEGTPIFS